MARAQRRAVAARLDVHDRRRRPSRAAVARAGPGLVMRLHVLCLHDVVRGHCSSPWAVTEEEIDGIVEEYRAAGYALVTLDELSSVPDRALALTVDDACAGAASWLLRRSASFAATVFVVSWWIDEPHRIPPTERYSAFCS